MRSPAELRDGLADLAATVRPGESPEVRVLREARRIRARRRLTGGTVAAVCLAMMVRIIVAGAGPQLVAPPPDGPFLGWPAAGAVDAGLVREATEVWDRAGPHTAVRVLVATRHRKLRDVVVLQGYDKRDAARLAFFTSDATAADALRLRADRPAPDPVTTQVISLVSSRLTGPAGEVSGDAWGTYAIALAMPGVTIVHVSSTTIDEEMRQDPSAPTGRFVVRGLLLASTAPTTVITGFTKPARILAKPEKVFAVPADGGAEGDAQAVRGDVVARGGQQIVVALREGRAVRPGQLAVVAAGLVGRVTAVDPTRDRATIDLVTSTGFAGQAHTDISDVPGSLRGTGGALLLEHLPTGPKMDVYEGNRVVMPDPAQHSDQAGAVTVGRAAATRAPGADAVELTPTADLAGLREVSIMTPYSG